jgi:hypothetical protein
MYSDEFIQLQVEVAEFINDRRSDFLTQAEYNLNPSVGSGNPKVIAMIGDAVLRAAAISNAVRNDPNGLNMTPGTLQHEVESVISNGHLSKIYDILIGSRMATVLDGRPFFTDELLPRKFGFNEKSKGLFIELLLGLTHGSQIFSSLCDLIFDSDENIKRFYSDVKCITDFQYSVSKQRFLASPMPYSEYDDDISTPDEVIITFEDFARAYDNMSCGKFAIFTRDLTRKQLDEFTRQYKRTYPDECEE